MNITRIHNRIGVAARLGFLGGIIGLLSAATAVGESRIPSGELQIVGAEGDMAPVCPLKHTDVEADIVGFVARTTVRQVFHNPLDRKIEAVYVFPLPQDAAVDDMVMLVGDRRIVGQIKERSEAREIYEAAKAAGHVASLLDQERPNIFTQSVANIEPGVQVEIEISYVETLKYEDGVFEWVFPMVVGPRYIPGGGSAPDPMTTGTPTPQVPDGDKITPPVTPEGTRAGHDISLTVLIDAGMELHDLESVLHEVDVATDGPARAAVTLQDQATIPNKDFVLRYRLATDEIGDAYLAHHDARGDFFTLILQPPRRVVPEQLVNRELIFVLDVSGSMRGFPIEKAKEVMSKLIDTMHAGDTFNLITFAGRTSILWDAPRPNTEENRAAVQELLMSQRGGGGTEMMKAINAALVQTANDVARPLSPRALADLPADGRRVVVRLGPDLHWTITDAGTLNVSFRGPDPATPITYGIVYSGGQSLRETFERWMTERGTLIVTGRWETRDGQRLFTAESAEWDVGQYNWPIRIVCFMTDGYVGNDMAIIDAVKKNADTTRVFSFGVGNSVNRYLLDGMAHAGRGEVEYVTLESQAGGAVERFHERVLAPVLTDIEIDWGTLPVADVYPKLIPDLFSAKPIMVHGRLTGPAEGTITLRGNTGEGGYVEQIGVSLPAEPPDHDALASLWARAKVEDLMNRDLTAMQQGAFPEDLKSEITNLGIEFRLMTQFTSFVAVEELTVTVGGEPTKINVPVEMPDGVSYEGVFGERSFNLMQARPGKLSYSLGVPLRGRGAGTAGRMAPPPQPAARREVQGAGIVLDLAEGKEDGGEAVSERSPESKLAEPLRGLAEKVEKEGEDGNLTIGALKVVDYKVDVMIFLSDVSEKTLTALKELGFVQSGESKAIKLLIGTIDVRKLDDLAKLDAVIRVKPVKS